MLKYKICPEISELINLPKFSPETAILCGSSPSDKTEYLITQPMITV